MLAERGLPAPRPLLLDLDGTVYGFDAPTVVMSRLPGRAMLMPRDLPAHLEQLASTLAKLHQVPVADLGFLPDEHRFVAKHVQRGPSSTDPVEVEVCAVVGSRWPAIDRAPHPRTLIHGDFWPGNTIWYRERLVGVIDWEMTRLGDPAKDVATCRCDLSMLFGAEAAEAFTRHYEARTGGAVADLSFWDLYVVRCALRYLDQWEAGYHALGRTDLTTQIARSRVTSYVRGILADAQR
jgi:aminoglycoside phosphotransferase (APT) family kinase protein